MFGCLFAVSDNKLFMEKFQEVAESQSPEEESEEATEEATEATEEATEAAGLLDKLSVGETSEAEAPAATKSDTVKEAEAPAEEKAEEKAPAVKEEKKDD